MDRNRDQRQMERWRDGEMEREIHRWTDRLTDWSSR